MSHQDGFSSDTPSEQHLNAIDPTNLEKHLATRYRNPPKTSQSNKTLPTS